jgi:hypothetical protein
MDWDGLKIALLELVATHVRVDILVAGTPMPVAGLEGVLINVTTGFIEGQPEVEASINLRVRSEGSADTSYVHVLRPGFRGAEWNDWAGERALVISFLGLEAVSDRAHGVAPSIRPSVTLCWRTPSSANRTCSYERAREGIVGTQSESGKLCSSATRFTYSACWASSSGAMSDC